MINSTLCYLKNKNSTLMLYRNKKNFDIHEGKWNGLGGKLEPGESPDECVVREVREESGYLISNPILKGCITFPLFDSVNDWIVFIYTCNKYNGKMINSKEGKLEWIETKDLLNLNVWDGDRIFMPWLENKPFFSAKFIYKDSVFKKYSVNFY